MESEIFPTESPKNDSLQACSSTTQDFGEESYIETPCSPSLWDPLTIEETKLDFDESDNMLVS